MEGWKDGKMERWKKMLQVTSCELQVKGKRNNGRMEEKLLEEWNVGIVRRWKTGILEEWKNKVSGSMLQVTS